MTARRLLVGAAAAVVTAAALLLGGTLRGGGSSEAAAVPVATEVVRFDREGSSFEQSARTTGDATYYTRAEFAFRRALRLAPNDLTATIGLGVLALSRHQFHTALALGRRAVALSPSTARGHAVVGDALVELGRYEQAFVAFNRMASIKPGVASYARVSYARELLGDFAGAVEAMRYAADAAAGESEAFAWSHTQLGKLFWSHGRLDAAEREYRLALRARPGYVYALEALAHVEAARGREAEAVRLARRAAEIMPLPQFVITFGDLLRAAGRGAEARRQYALIAAIDRLQQANGVKTDLELALFQVDHGVRLTEALRRARAARAERPSIDAEDVLAWALARNERCAEALRFSKRALRLGTLDASKFFHHAMIERCLGHRAEAERWSRRALRLNPKFSPLWSPLARRLAR